MLKGCEISSVFANARHFLVWTDAIQVAINLICRIPAKNGPKKLRNHWDNVLCNNIFLKDRLGKAYFSSEAIWKGSPDDAINRKHHDSNAAIWDKDDPEKLVEQTEVRSTLVDKTSLWKANEDHSEDDVEERRVGKENVERKVESESKFAAEFWINLAG